MGLVLKHVQPTKAGTWHYRRKIPEALRETVGKREFKRLLGHTQAEATRNYPAVNAEFERTIAEARAPKVKSSPSAGPLVSPLAAYREARERLRDAEASLQRLDADEAERLRDVYADSALARYPSDKATGEPVGVPAETRLFANALRAGGKLQRPEPTLEDARDLYVKDKIAGSTGEATKRSRVARVMRYLHATLGRGKLLAALERPDAREVRDHMLSDLGMNPATARRYMNDIRALVEHGIVEFGLRGRAENPFRGLPIRVETVAKDERKPFTAAQIMAVRQRLSASAGEELRRIWRMLEGTGCRLGEVTGLLVSDVMLADKRPYLNLIFHPHRRLKNAGSVRRVPLIGDALAAAKEAVKAAGDGEFLFPSYGHERGADAASQALMKHVRAVTEDRKVVIHSLRHTMEDRLIVAKVSDFDRNLVLGHSQRGMADRYGGAEARLEAAYRAVKAAARH